ncbi:MAG TPA: TetR/AcrR family transcriptional regulator [Polyangiaceae bacterium]|nr:TetR/AcrR family transcriptional regulator [Polyangiaceae bacterium]
MRTHGRSARVVESVLTATAEALGRSGYAALRVEDVALASGVNKTTIYRRWPTKVDLVTAAIQRFSQAPELPDTGTLREDLLVLLRHTCAKASNALGQGIVRTIQLERAHPEVDLVTQKLAATHLRVRRIVVERAIARGELPADTDVELLLELVFAPVVRRVIFANRKAPESFLEAVLDVVLSGARSGAASRRATN